MEKIIYKGREVFPVKYDLVFKAVFVSGGDLELLASLLSSILGINISAENMTITNTEIPPTHADGKMSRLDIRVKTDDGKHIDVEIQLGDEHNMAKRSLFYESKLYTEQMASKMEFEEICPAIAINILGFTFLPFKKYHSRFTQPF